MRNSEKMRTEKQLLQRQKLPIAFVSLSLILSIIAKAQEFQPTWIVATLNDTGPASPKEPSVISPPNESDIPLVIKDSKWGCIINPSYFVKQNELMAASWARKFVCIHSPSGLGVVYSHLCPLQSPVPSVGYLSLPSKKGKGSGKSDQSHSLMIACHYPK